MHGNLLINQLADATDQQRQTFETATSWIKARFDPLVARYLPSKDDPLVKTKGPLVPKLDLERRDSEARPMSWARNLADQKLGGLKRN